MNVLQRYYCVREFNEFVVCVDVRNVCETCPGNVKGWRGEVCRCQLYRCIYIKQKLNFDPL